MPIDPHSPPSHPAPPEVWLTGFNRNLQKCCCFEVVGIFETKELAAATCRDRRFFIAGPIRLNATSSEEFAQFPGLERPNQAEFEGSDGAPENLPAE